MWLRCYLLQPCKRETSFDRRRKKPPFCSFFPYPKLEKSTRIKVAWTNIYCQLWMRVIDAFGKLVWRRGNKHPTRNISEDLRRTLTNTNEPESSRCILFDVQCSKWIIQILTLIHWQTVNSNFAYATNFFPPLLTHKERKIFIIYISSA